MATLPKSIQDGTVVSSSTVTTGGVATRDGGRTAITATTTQTTTTQSTFDNGVIDISIIPFMRPIEIDFVAEGMKPQRKVWFFFDDVNVTDYIIKTDVLELSANADVAVFNQGVSNNDSLISGSSANNAVIRLSRRDIDNDDDGSDRPRRRVLEISNAFGTFVNTAGITGSVTGNTSSIRSHLVRGVRRLGKKGGGGFAGLSSNTINLHAATRFTANNFWGTSGANNIVIIPHGGQGAGRNKIRAVKANIAGFNNVTQTLTLTQTFAQLFPDEGVIRPPADYGINWSEATDDGSDFRISREGTIAGTFVVPPGMFRTGERVFKIIDDPSGDPDDCTTRAEYKFNASGLQEVRNSIVLRDTKSTTTTVVTPPVTPPVPPRPRPQGGGRQGNGGRGDPIAQTFFVNESEHPNGIFLSKVEIWFRSKDEILPVTLQIRPVVNGYPASYEILDGGISTVKAEDIRVYEDSPYITDTIVPQTGTYFKFPAPVYLAPGEYAMVMVSPSVDYEVWISELGGTIIGSTRTVSEQPYIGSFFKSQNASTWDAIQLEDLMFKLYQCEFASSGTVVFDNVAPVANVPADMTYTHADDIFLRNTAVSYVQSFDAGATFAATVPDTNFVPTARLTIDSGTEGKYKLRATLVTTDPDVSPIVYSKNFNFLAIENIINNANISNADITITNEGSGFTQNANVALVITGGGATLDAVGYAIANTAGSGTGANGIDYIIITDGGEKYVNTANILVVGGSNTQTFAVSSEINSSGGPAIAKYISKKVTLAEGFDSGDLRVWLTAYKPIGTDLKVYYKIRNALDPVPFEKQPYVLMEQKTPLTVKSINEYDNKEYEYRPYASANSITYTSGTNTYRSFNQYAIKVVLVSENTVKYPVVYDMRAIALPAENL